MIAFSLLGNDDIIPEIGNVTIPPFLVIGCFEVEILDDDILEGEEGVEIAVTSDDVTVTNGVVGIIIQDDSDLQGIAIASWIHAM